VLDAGLAPFRSLVEGGVGLVMMSTATYSAYDPAGPAAFSKPIVTGRLRGDLGFGGVVVTDDLDTPAVRSYRTPADAALASVEAGVDMVIMVGSESTSHAGYKRLLAAAEGGTLTRSSLEQSHRRIEQLKQQLQP
jgi:beta-N-acetylhexosaminidase